MQAKNHSIPASACATIPSDRSLKVIRCSQRRPASVDWPTCGGKQPVRTMNTALSRKTRQLRLAEAKATKKELRRKPRKPTATVHKLAQEAFTPDKLPDPWLIDSEYLLEQLARIRDLALKVPFTNESYQPTNTVVDAIWRLEEQLRYLLHLHREGQREFATKSDQRIAVRHQAEKDALDQNEAARAKFRQLPAFLACA